MIDVNEGDKFVIEIGTRMFDEPGKGCLYFIKGFNTLVFDDYGIQKLKRADEFNQDDCDRARAEGFADGYNAGVKAAEKELGKLIDSIRTLRDVLKGESI